MFVLFLSIFLLGRRRPGRGIFLVLCVCLVGAACSGFSPSCLFPAVRAASSVSFRGLVPGAVGILSDVLLLRLLLSMRCIVDFYFAVLSGVFPRWVRRATW